MGKYVQEVELYVTYVICLFMQECKDTIPCNW